MIASAFILELGCSLAWKLLPLPSERNNSALVTAVISITANNSVTISFKSQYNSARA